MTSQPTLPAGPALFHVSEDGAIAEFVPRPMRDAARGLDGTFVWAVEALHLPGYLVPRDCPRVTYRAQATTAAADRACFLGASSARCIIAIEPQWLGRAMAMTLFVYELPAGTFTCIDRDAGHHVSPVAVTPCGVRAVADPIAEMLTHDVELRLVRDLPALQDRVMRSSLSFSSTRLRNARPVSATAGPGDAGTHP